MKPRHVLWPAALLLVAGLALVFLRPEEARTTGPLAAPGPDVEGAVPLASAGTATVESPVSQAERVSSLAAGDLSVPVGVRLRGPGRLEGVVLERGALRPVSGARVDLLAYPPAGATVVARMMRLGSFRPGVVRRTEPVAVARTDERGAFRFEGVRSGRYFLEARGERHVADHLEQARVDRDGSGGPVVLHVRPGGRLVGRLVDEAARGLSGASIVVHPGPGTVLTRLRENDLRFRRTTTDADGRFVVPGLPPGEGWDVAAFGRGFAVTHAVGLTVRAGEDTEVQLEARPGATLRGVVKSGAPDRAGASVPLPGAHLGVLPRGLRDLHFADELLELGGATTDAQGRYVLRDVPLGQVDVVAVAPNHVPGRGALVQTFAGVETVVEDIVLATGPSVTLEIVDPEGKPLPDVRATWWVADWKSFDFDLSFTPFLMQAVDGFTFPTSDAEGRLVAGPFGPAEWHDVWLEKPGFPNQRVRWSESEGPRKRVVFAPGASVEGFVLDAERAEPLDSFTVFSPERADADDGAPAGFNPFSGGLLFESSGGRFRLDGLRPGRVELRVEAPGYAAEELALEVAAGESTKGLIFRLARGRTVRGQVQDARGEGVPGAQVLAVRASGQRFQTTGNGFRVDTRADRIRQNKEFGLALLGAMSSLGVSGPGAVTSDGEGRFELDSIPGEGPFRLEVRHRDHATTLGEELRAEPGEVLEGVVVRLTGGSTLTGTVSDRLGNPVSGAILVATPSETVGQVRGDIETFQAETDGEGRYRMTHLRPGNYLVSTVRGDAALSPMSLFGTLNFDFVQVPPEAVVELDFVDTSVGGCRVFGAVTAAGQAIDSGMLFAVGFGAENLLGVDVKVAQVSGGGAYEFPGLAPGNYQVTYEGSGRRVRFDLEVPELPEHRADLPFPAGRVAGRVVEEASGDPVRGAVVSLAGLEERFTAGLLEGLLPGEPGRNRVTTDGRGRFSFERLSAGEYEVTVQAPGAPGLAPAPPARIVLGPDEDRGDLRLALPAALGFEGRVLLTSGEPVVGALVRVFSKEALTLEVPPVRSDDAGRFHFVGLGEGSFTVLAEARGFAPTPSRRVTLVRGRVPEPVELSLRPGAAVRVRVVDGRTGAPVVGASGRLLPIGEAVPEEASAPTPTGGTFLGLLGGSGVSDSQGWLDLGRRVAGEYKLEVFRGDRRAEQGPLTLVEGAQLDLEIPLPVSDG